MGSHAGNELARPSGMLCQQKGSGEWNPTDALGTGICVSLGCQAEMKLEAELLHNEPGASLPERHIAHRRRKRAAGQLPARRLSCVVRGRLVLLAMQYQSEPFPVGILRAGPWPETITAPQKQPKPSALNKKKTPKEKERRKRHKRRAREHARALG